MMISIVIVNWNSGSLLEKCVLSLLENAPGCELIIVDNASADSSLEFASKLDAALTAVMNESNLGFAGASNLGWRASKGESVLFLNPDTESRPGAVIRLAGTLARDETAWAVAGRLVDPPGQRRSGPDVRAFPTLRSVAAEMLFLEEAWPGNPWTRAYMVSGWDRSSAREVEQPPGACLMVRRTALESLNGFDENFHPAWFEDVDLCRRIRESGGRILFEPAAEFLHHGGSSLTRMPREQFLEYFYGNQLRYFRKHHDKEMTRRIQGLIVIGMCLRAAVSLLYPLMPATTRRDASRSFWRLAGHFAALREDRL